MPLSLSWIKIIIQQACPCTEHSPSSASGSKAAKPCTSAASNGDSADDEPRGSDTKPCRAGSVGTGEAAEKGAREEKKGGSGDQSKF